MYKKYNDCAMAKRFFTEFGCAINLEIFAIHSFQSLNSCTIARSGSYTPHQNACLLLILFYFFYSYFVYSAVISVDLFVFITRWFAMTQISL